MPHPPYIVDDAHYARVVKVLHDAGYVLCAHGAHHREVWRKRGYWAPVDLVRKVYHRPKDVEFSP